MSSRWSTAENYDGKEWRRKTAGSWWLGSREETGGSLRRGTTVACFLQLGLTAYSPPPLTMHYAGIAPQTMLWCQFFTPAPGSSVSKRKFTPIIWHNSYKLLHSPQTPRQACNTRMDCFYFGGGTPYPNQHRWSTLPSLRPASFQASQGWWGS